MSETATTDLPIDDRLLDELVPPPGPRWRRGLLWAAFAGIIGVSTWAFTSGTVVPQVSSGVDAWGGDGPVAASVWLRNDSRVDLEVVDGPRSRPGLVALGTTSDDLTALMSTDFRPAADPADPYPVRLAPGDAIQLTLWFRVSDCQALAEIDPTDDAIDFQVRVADGPASWFTAERSVEASDVTSTGTEPVAWPIGMAWAACPG